MTHLQRDTVPLIGPVAPVMPAPAAKRVVQYISTRGGAEESLASLKVQGLCPEDGGLYVPTHFPDLSGALPQLRSLSFAGLAHRILSEFLDETLIPGEQLRELIDRSFATFESAEVTPVRELADGMWLLELYKGPTLSFKDVALQFLGNLLEYLVRGSATDKPLVVLGATSGDTGSAAIAGLEGKQGIRVVILYPDGRVSPTQELQMVAGRSDNVVCLACPGTFDDCQALVKQAFSDGSVAEHVQLLGINSINVVRILVQTVYYFYSYFRVVPDGSGPVNYVVPTGNFGDILAGYYAKRMGLPIGRLVVATNENDILARFMASGEYRIAGAAKPTVTPSMDIQVSSNFERYLFELVDRDAAAVADWMQQLAKTGSFRVTPGQLEAARRDFVAYGVRQEQCLQSIELTAKLTGGSVIIDPHTAIGVCAAETFRSSPAGRDAPLVCLATAHPAKFPDTVRAALQGSSIDVKQWIVHPSIETLRDAPKRTQKLASFTLEALSKHLWGGKC